VQHGLFGGNAKYIFSLLSSSTHMHAPLPVLSLYVMEKVRSLGVAFVGGGAVAACNCSRNRGAIDGCRHQGKEEHHVQKKK